MMERRKNLNDKFGFAVVMKYNLLKDIAEINMGQSPDSLSYNNVKRGLPFYQGNADFGELYPIAKTWCDTPKKTAKKNDILISVRAPIGAINYTSELCCIGRGLAAITVEDDIDRNYIYYFLKAKNSELINQGTGSTFKAIGRPVLEMLKVPAISEKQKKLIIKSMDFLVDIIKLRKKELILLDELIKARFIEMFGDPYTNPLKWEKLKIKDAVTVEPQNGLYKPQSDYVTDRSGIPILRIDGFYDGIVTDFASLKRLKCSETEKQKYLLLEDDIVINRVNSIEYLGKCAHIKGLLEDTVYESNMMRMHFDPETYNSAYICKLLCSQFIYDQIVNHAKKAVNQASINQKDVLDFNIYQPPIDLQNQFADFIQQVDKSRFNIKKSIIELEREVVYD